MSIFDITLQRPPTAAAARRRRTSDQCTPDRAGSHVATQQVGGAVGAGLRAAGQALGPGQTLAPTC